MTEKEIEKIYNEGYRAVYWTAMALLKNEADAEDVVQDTFVSFIESYGNIEDTSKATALLKKIAANKSLNRLKSVRTENVDDEVLENLETVPEDFLPDSMVESAEMRKIVMDIIEKSLSEDVRRTIILFYFNEMSTKEISEALGVPQGTVLWRLNFARKNITCYFSPPNDFPKFYGDPRSLEQVFNNLIGNSVDAFDGQDGIITLKLSLKENESGRRQILISESDNGPGIPEDKIDSIFEPFMTTKKNGNGWGLALSKRIITSHKGTIQVKSFQGGGTVFEILLPLNDEMG